MPKTHTVDANNAPASSAEPDANTGAASSATQTGTETSEKTLLSVVEEAAAASQAAQVTEGGDAAPSGSTIEPDKGAQVPTSNAKKEDGVADGKPPVKPKVDEEGKEIPPFHEHPRWKETVTERNELRTKVQEFEKVKPLVETQKGIVDYCNSHNISPEQFQQGLEMLALINTNPAEALKRLQPVFKQLTEYDESALPKDLEDRVAQGLDIEVAQEIARLRAQNKGAQFNGQINAQRQAQMQLQSRQQAMISWEANTMKTDPDFKPKAKADDVDGKYEFVVNTFRGLAAVQPPASPQDVVRLVQQAYDSVNRTFTSRLTPRTSTGKILPSSGSSVTAEKEPETMEEAVMQAASRHGLV